MLIWSVLPPAAGVCANPIATSKAGTTISRNTRFMESSEKSRLAAICIPLGFDCASDFSVEFSRVRAPAGKPGASK
jgi:hypothetical protein